MNKQQDKNCLGCVRWKKCQGTEDKECAYALAAANAALVEENERLKREVRMEQQIHSGYVLRGDEIMNEMRTRAEVSEHERDALRATIAEIEAWMEQMRGCGEYGFHNLFDAGLAIIEKGRGA